MNVPHSSADQDAGASDRIDHIDFILNDALRSTYCELERDGSLNKSIDMQEANRRTDAFFDSTLMILSGSNNQEQSEHLQNIFCRECIERWGLFTFVFAVLYVTRFCVHLHLTCPRLHLLLFLFFFSLPNFMQSRDCIGCIFREFTGRVQCI